MFEGLTPEKEKRVKIACVLVIALLVPAFVIYYEYQIAAANNIQQMQAHARGNSQPVTANEIGNLTKPTGTTP